MLLLLQLLTGPTNAAAASQQRQLHCCHCVPLLLLVSCAEAMACSVLLPLVHRGCKGSWLLLLLTALHQLLQRSCSSIGHTREGVMARWFCDYNVAELAELAKR